MSNDNSIDTVKTPAQRWLRPALVAIPVVAILIALTVLQPWSSFPGPQSVMAKVYAATEGLQSYRIYSSTMSTIGGETSTQTSRVAFVAPDLYHVEIVNDGNAIEVISIGGKLYTFGGSGSAITIAWPGTSIMDKKTTLRMLDMLTDLQQLPDEEIEGVNCLHLRGRVDMERMIEKQKAALDPADPGYKDKEDYFNQAGSVTTSIGAQEGYNDWEHQEVEYSITINNNSNEAVRDVRVTIATKLLKDENRPMVVAEPEIPPTLLFLEKAGHSMPAARSMQPTIPRRKSWNCRK